MEYINTHFAPEPSGHYSQAVVHAGLVFVSGQLPIDPKTGEKSSLRGYWQTLKLY